LRFAAVDEWSHKNTFLHQLDPRAKIVATLIVLFAVSRGNLLAPTAFILAGVAFGKLPIGAVLLRACVALPFAFSFAVATALSGHAQSGLVLAIRSYVSALAVLVLIGTTPLPSILEGFRRLGAPAVLLEVIQFVHRYLFLLAEQTQRMATAARARGARRSFAAIAGSVGVLFARSYDRAEAIHRSMLARGYTGSLPSRERLRFGAPDLCLVLFACVAASLAFV
jgi:cobalt/nickel transport system permease protein